MGFQGNNLLDKDIDALSEAEMQIIAEQLNAIERGAGVEAVSNGLLLSDSLLAVGIVLAISLATFAVVKMLPALKKISNKA